MIEDEDIFQAEREKDDESWGNFYKARYGYDTAHLSGKWYEKQKELYYVFSFTDLRKLVHYRQITMVDDTPCGWLFLMTKKGISRCCESGYTIDIGEDMPEIEE